MASLQELRDAVKEEWCGGACPRAYLPSQAEILQGLVEQDGDGRLSLRTTGGGGGGGTGGDVNIESIGGNVVTTFIPVSNPGGQGMVGGGLVPEQYTQVVQTLPAPSAESEEYVYTLVGGGTATVTVTYSDSTKDTLVSAVRS